MRSCLSIIALTFVALSSAHGWEKKIKLQDLPPAVRLVVDEQTKNATLRGLSTEIENGQTLYEAELSVNGHVKDMTFDSTGKTVSVEEETTLDAIPAAARDAIRKSAGSGRIRKIETVTEKNATFYEAHVRKGLRTTEVKVDAAGNPAK